VIRSQRSPYGTSLLGAGAVHHIRLGHGGMSALSSFYDIGRRRWYGSSVPEAVIQKRQNSFKSLAMNTGPEKCFFTSAAQVE
jgi:hypothetical protein